MRSAILVVEMECAESFVVLTPASAELGCTEGFRVDPVEFGEIDMDVTSRASGFELVSGAWLLEPKPKAT